MKRNKENLKSRENLEEDLHNMSIEDIMKDGFDRDTAKAIYEVEHNIGLSEPMDAEDFIKMLEKM